MATASRVETKVIVLRGQVRSLETKAAALELTVQSAWNDIAVLKGENIRLADKMKSNNLVERVAKLEAATKELLKLRGLRDTQAP